MTDHQSRLQKVLEILLDQKRNPRRGFNLGMNHHDSYLASPYGEERVYEGWLPVWAFQGQDKGGSSGDKRLRELRYLKGIPIEQEIHVWERNGKILRTPVYRLACDPGEIDSVNIRYVPKKVEQGILEIK